MRERVWLSLFGLLALAAVSAGQRSCTSSDYAGEYTECVHGVRNAIYYKKEGVACVGGVPQPDNVFQVPCDISCQAGEYLKFGSRNTLGCEKCPAGEYSVGGGTQISADDWNNDTLWTNFGPTGIASFRSWCIDTRDRDVILPASICPGWEMVDGAYADSNGDKTADNQESVLEMTVRLVRSGTMTVEYMVDAEQNYDFFSIEVDNVNVLSGISHQLEFTRFSTGIAAGVHSIKFKFTKDFSLSDGRNAAFIRTIEISGTTYADSECFPCPAGTFRNLTGGSNCDPCLANTFSNTEGAVNCLDCASTQFSYPGSKTCLPRAPCRESDWYTFYSPCINGVHNLEYRWLEPMICDETAPTADQKPASVANVPCAKCNPGYIRNAIGQCVACPANQYAVNNERCEMCPPGYAGRRDFTWTNFEEYPIGVDYSTRCEGTCGSSGWRLAGRYLDSGIGHGSYVDISFSLPLTVVAAGHVSFNFSFVCQRSCQLSFVDEIVNSDGSRRLLRSRSFYSFWSDSGLVEYPTEPGNHMFTWYFSQYDPLLLARNDRILLHSINVTDVAINQGGASQCVACGPGTRVDSVTSTCQPCPSGFSSGPLATQCTACPANTFAEKPGSPTCDPCGAGSVSAPGSSRCNATCRYSPPGSSMAYDLNSLRPTNGTFGPVRDAYNREYRFNLCEPNMGLACKDEDGIYVQSYTCQTERGRGADAGHFMEFMGGQNATGVVVRFSRGLEGCGYGYYGTGARPRVTEINFVCDPDAGLGSPSVTSTENPRCSYFFEWRSLYACPVCTRNDYDFYYTDCINGRRDAVYFWKDNPKRCHGGVTLPATSSSTCSIDESYVCPAGTRKTDSCVPCDAGSFSLGGASIVQTWANMPDNFRSFCSGCKSLWAPRGSFVESGNAGSVLQAVFSFVRPGNLTFSYTAVFGRGEYLQISMDGSPVSRDRRWSALREYQTTIAVPKAGAHIFTWEFRRNVTYSDTGLSGYVRIFSVVAEGTRFHDLACTKCPVGYFAAEDGARKCTVCPANTYADVAGRSDCKPCAADQWSPPGSARCFQKQPCSDSDYQSVFSSCSNGMRTQRYVLIQPSVCRESTPRPQTAIPCTCPGGTKFDSASDSCVSCPNGAFLPDGQSDCRPASPGTFARRTLRLAELQAQVPSLPGGSTTNCSGTCLAAWRITSAGLHSGVQVGDASSYLTVPVETVSLGSYASLNISFVGSPLASLQVLIDSSLYSEIKPAVFKRALQLADVPLPLGRHNLTLNFISPPGDTSTRSYAILSSLDIVGSSTGAAAAVQCPPGSVSATSSSSSCTPCGAGTAAPEAGMSTCSACPAGSFASDAGSASCIPCGAGSFTNGPGSTKCLTSCSFAMQNGTHFDLRQLTERTLYDLRNSREIILNPCGNKSRLGCESYVCSRTPDSPDVIVLGRNPEFTPPVESQQWLLTFSEGRTCPSSGKSSLVTIRFRCDLSSPNNLGEPRVVEADDCTTYLEWVTPAACAACSPTDFSPVRGKCQAGIQRVTYVAPSSCYNSGYDQPFTEELSCNDVEFPLIAVVVALVVFVGLVVVLVVVWMKNRRLYAEYSLLKDAHMDQLDNQLESSTQLDAELEEDSRL